MIDVKAFVRKHLERLKDKYKDKNKTDARGMDCSWCNAKMEVLAADYGPYWIYKCTKCHHEVQGL